MDGGVRATQDANAEDAQADDSRDGGVRVWNAPKLAKIRQCLAKYTRLLILLSKKMDYRNPN